MIRSREDLRFYLQEDKKQYDLRHPWWLGIFCGSELSHAYRLVRSLRKYEYALNDSYSFWGKLRLAFRTLSHKRLAFKYKIFIVPNRVGYGLRIRHFGGGIYINCHSMGNYCGITSGVVVGNKGSNENRATIGNNVGLTLGCKIIGKINIGDNVTVAPNSVVVKDVPSNAIVSGISAKILKFKE